jgi:serine/threonine protein kinase
MRSRKKAELPLPAGFEDGKTYRGYVIGSQIGKGGFGRVFEASKATFNSDQRYAIKVVSLKTSESGFIRTTKMIENESSIMKKIHHDNILRLLDYFTDEQEGVKHHILVMPLCDCDLRKFINLFGAFIELKIHKVMHRDIKMENIFWQKKNDTLVIGDFGLAKMGSEWADTIGGSPFFSAPEIIELQSKLNVLDPSYNGSRKEAHSYDSKVDVYCLGIVFYELVAGIILETTSTGIKRVITNKDVKTELIADERFKFGANDKIDSGIQNLIEGMLERNVLNRLSWDQVIRHPIFDKQFAEAMYDPKKLQNPEQLIKTFVDDQSLICHFNEDTDFQKFDSHRKRYIKLQTEEKTSSVVSVSIVRHDLNQAIGKFFELGKKHIIRRLLQKQKELSLPESLKGIIAIGEAANLNSLVYFARIFTVLETTANQILHDNYEPNKEVVSLAKSRSQAQDLHDMFKIELDPDQHAEASKLDIEALEKAIEGSIQSMCKTLAVYSGSERAPDEFEVNIRDVIGNLKFLASFRSEFISKEAANKHDWLHSMEELAQYADRTIVSAYFDRARKEEQSTLAAF